MLVFFTILDTNNYANSSHNSKDNVYPKKQKSSNDDYPVHPTSNIKHHVRQHNCLLFDAYDIDASSIPSSLREPSLNKLEPNLTQTSTFSHCLLFLNLISITLVFSAMPVDG